MALKLASARKYTRNDVWAPADTRKGHLFIICLRWFKGVVTCLKEKDNQNKFSTFCFILNSGNGLSIFLTSSFRAQYVDIKLE